MLSSIPIEVPQTSINSGPIAVKTRLGWMAYGPNKHYAAKESQMMKILKNC